MTQPARLAVFVSGGGTNLQALLDHFNATGSPIARVELVVASRGGIRAIDRARTFGVAVETVDSPGGGEAEERWLTGILEQHRIDVVVLAGYLKLVPLGIVERYAGRMINIHPALLPAFGGHGMYGIRVHRAVIASGARVTGATVHLVDSRYDEGRIIAQWPVPVHATDTEEVLAERVLRVEHLLLPAAVESLVRADRASTSIRETFELIDADAPRVESVRRLIT